MRSYKGRGVVLHTLKYGDSSMIVYLLSDVGGRKSFIVRGVRSKRGRGSKAAIMQPMFPIEFEGVQAINSQLERFKEVRAAVTLQNTPFDVRKSTIALFMAEILYRLIRESEPNKALFDFVWGSTLALDAIEQGVANFHLWFLAKLAMMLGFQPGNQYVEGAFFDIREGLYVSQKPPHTYYIDQQSSRVLRDMIQCDVQHLGEVGLNREQRANFLNSMVLYFDYHLDAMSSIQSIRVLREVF